MTDDWATESEDQVVVLVRQASTPARRGGCLLLHTKIAVLHASNVETRTTPNDYLRMLRGGFP